MKKFNLFFLMVFTVGLWGLMSPPARAVSTSNRPDGSEVIKTAQSPMMSNGDCVVPCPLGAIAEIETCGTDTNGGCNMTPTPAFEPIALWETVCGTAWADGEIRDTDWYQVTITTPTRLIFTATAEFPVEVFLMYPSDSSQPISCSNYSYDINTAPACTEAQVSRDCQPGTYWLWVGDQNFEGNPCGSGHNNYVATLKTPYCEASSTICDEYISNVTVGSINNSSGCDKYADYTALSTSMTIGGAYPITVTNGPPTYLDDQCGIWVDWNHDYDFDDPGEAVTVNGTPGGGPYTATIVPPLGALVGDARMRVRILYTDPVSPCGDTQYGEVEDYTINVSPYCEASGGCDEYISNVAVGNINNASDCSGYADYTAIATEMTIGGAYPITVTNGILYYPVDQCGIWVDWNQDGDFDDPGEAITVSGTPGVGPYTATIVPPLNAAVGDARMRVRILYMGEVSPCGDTQYGEVEDYTLSVKAEDLMTKWFQPPIYNPDSPYPGCFWGWNEQSIYWGSQVVADDWPSHDGSPISNIHWWGSYQNWSDTAPPLLSPDTFFVVLWSDVPARGSQWSRPGKQLANWTVSRGELQERYAGCSYHPDYGFESCFRYDFNLQYSDFFYTKREPAIYWLSIFAYYYIGMPSENPWGWLTRPHYFNDDAVRIFSPTYASVGESFGSGEPIKDLAGQTWDMAFIVTTTPNADLNRDGVVDLKDFTILAEQWLTTRP